MILIHLRRLASSIVFSTKTGREKGRGKKTWSAAPAARLLLLQR